MIFGAEIADDFFEEPKEKKERKTVAGDIKICSRKWFLRHTASITSETEILKSLRYKADYLYSKGHYQVAIKAYERCLELLPPTNKPGARECMEGLSRSLLRDGNPEKALEWALKMHEAASTPDQIANSCDLLATVCHTLGKFEEELEALHSCVEEHKKNSEFWLRLAYCYSGLFNICLPNSGCAFKVKFCCNFKRRTFIANTSTTSIKGRKKLDLSSVKTNDAVQNSIENIETDLSNLGVDNTNAVEKCEVCTMATQVISACLIKARILSSRMDNPRPISRRKVYVINRKIDACLTHMEIDQNFIDEASKMLKSEMYTTKNETKITKSNLNPQNHHMSTCAQNRTEHLLGYN